MNGASCWLQESGGKSAGHATNSGGICRANTNARTRFRESSAVAGESLEAGSQKQRYLLLAAHSC
jgi:hypothetical protein